MSLSPEQCETLLHLARSAIRHTLGGEPFHAPLIEDEALVARAGCFVTLHESSNGRLRGCIGRLDNCPLAIALISSATDVLSDARFQDDPVESTDLKNISIEISVLSPMRPAAHPLDFDPKTDGIQLTIADRSGCFLPQVGQETGWTREQLLSRLCTEKLGVDPETWRTPAASLQTFSVQLIGPEPLMPTESDCNV
jgi:AmmeMemoRadiSam system protein A